MNTKIVKEYRNYIVLTDDESIKNSPRTIRGASTSGKNYPTMSRELLRDLTATSIEEEYVDKGRIDSLGTTLTNPYKDVMPKLNIFEESFIKNTAKKKASQKIMRPHKEMAYKALQSTPPNVDFYTYYMKKNSTKCANCLPEDRQDIFECEDCWETQLV